MDNFNLRKYLAEGKLLKEYDVDYFEVYNDGENVDIKFDSRGKAQRFIDGMMDNYKKEEEERYEKYAEMFKDNPEDMLYDPNPVPKYTIGYDSESYSMEEGESMEEAWSNDEYKEDYFVGDSRHTDIRKDIDREDEIDGGVRLIFKTPSATSKKDEIKKYIEAKYGYDTIEMNYINSREIEIYINPK
tara:strand:- start:505 stop:1065 length:561 start_codon:yes stop_codon:yes gene_type:complete